MTYDEYLTDIAIPFREYLAAHNDPEEYPGGWVSVDCDLICHTPTCPRNGQVIRFTVAENFNGEYYPCCGTCADEDGNATRYTDITFWGYQGEAFS